MPFTFNDFMNAVKADNSTYERVYSKIGVNKSRLHALVELLRNPATPEQVGNAMSQVPLEAWSKYQRTRKYLQREVAIAGFEVPAGASAIQQIQVFHTGTVVTGYGLGPDRAAMTGRGGRLDGRFYWSIEVVYTLHPNVDPQMYAPFRNVKDESTYKGFGLQPKTENGLLLAASAKPLWNADGPRHYNVKRG